MSEEYSISNNLEAQTMNNSKLKVFKQRIREVVAEFLYSTISDVSFWYKKKSRKNIISNWHFCPNDVSLLCEQVS